MRSSVPLLLARALARAASAASTAPTASVSVSAAASLLPYATSSAAATTRPTGSSTNRRVGGGDAPSSPSSSRRRRDEQPRSSGNINSSSAIPIEVDVEAIRRTFPVRVSPILLDGDYDGSPATTGDGRRSTTATTGSAGGKFWSVGDALRRAAASGPDGAMLATRRDVLEFLGVGDEGALLRGASRRGVQEEEHEEEQHEAGDKSSSSSSKKASPSQTSLSPLDLAVPELDAQLRPVAWWVALPSAAARKRAVAAADGRALGAGGRCRVSPGSPKEMVTATRGAARDWWSLKRAQTRRMAAQSGGQAVLVSGLPAGTTATALRGALAAAGLELRRSKVPVRMVGLGGSYLGGGARGGRRRAGKEAAAAEEEEQEAEGGRRKKAEADGGGADAENAAIVWMASMEEARRCERELHLGRELHIGGGGAGATAADDGSSSGGASAATSAVATTTTTAKVSVRVLP